MKKLLSKIGTKVWFVITAILAFTSFISFIQINSAWADNHNFNGFFGWLGIGFLFAGLAIAAGIKVVKLGGVGKQE